MPHPLSTTIAAALDTMRALACALAVENEVLQQEQEDAEEQEGENADAEPEYPDEEYWGVVQDASRALAEAINALADVKEHLA